MDGGRNHARGSPSRRGHAGQHAVDEDEWEAGLDQVVSIDTSIAHLAGALGRPTLVLLQARSTDWRWRAQPAWYPSARILRQPTQDDWAGAAEAAAEVIRGVLATDRKS